MTDQLHRCPAGWRAVRRCGFAHFIAPDGYVIAEGEGWGDENGDGDEEVWYAYPPGDDNGERPIGGADWPHLEDAIAAVLRARHHDELERLRGIGELRLIVAAVIDGNGAVGTMYAHTEGRTADDALILWVEQYGAELLALLERVPQ